MTEPHIPSDLSERVLMTSSLSSSRHLPILGSVWTTLEMKSRISFRCPLSPWREIRRGVNGSRKSRISTSRRLVTQMRRFGSRKSTSIFKSWKTFFRAVCKPEVFGHSSRASMMMKVGARFRYSSMSLRHWVSAASVGLRVLEACVEYREERIS